MFRHRDQPRTSSVGDAVDQSGGAPADLCPQGSVVIGASTYGLIREQAVVRPLGSPHLKGKSQPVEVYELLGPRDKAGSDMARPAGIEPAT